MIHKIVALLCALLVVALAPQPASAHANASGSQEKKGFICRFPRAVELLILRLRFVAACVETISTHQDQRSGGDGRQYANRDSGDAQLAYAPLPSSSGQLLSEP